MNFRTIFIVLSSLVVCLATGIATHSQTSFENVDFRNPVDIPMKLSGNFGEFRTNHFHTGIDIKTNGRTGYPVYAVEDGWVRRVKISPFGYGRALYLDHPNGFTSVYAHLSNYNDTITSFLSVAQEKIGRNEVDIFPNVNRLPVKKGDLIGFTGNSGRSGGPHLHFEIRTKDTEKPLNPLLLGFKITDNVKPSIHGIQIEAFSSNDLRGKMKNTKRHYAKGSGANYSIPGIVNVPNDFGLSVHSLDRITNSSNSFGIYSLELFVDEEKQFSMKMDSLDFSVGRYVNAQKNYSLFKSEKSSFHRCFVLPNNKLPIYSQNGDGVIHLTDNDIHSVRAVVTDAAGNASELNFKIRVSGSQIAGSNRLKDEVFKYDLPNSRAIEGCSIRMPAYRLLNDEVIDLKEYKKSLSSYGKSIQIGSESIPVQNKYIISLKLENHSELDSSKFYIARYNPKNGRFYNEGGEFKDGWIRARTKTFGVFTIKYDDTKPKATLNMSRSSLQKNGKFSVTISDDNAGIDFYEVYVNGEWISVYYNYKVSKLQGKIENFSSLEGQIFVRVLVADERKNQIVIEKKL